jgi:hypothetical protein
MIENIIKCGSITKEEALVDMVFCFVGPVPKAANIDFTTEDTETQNVGSNTSDSSVWGCLNSPMGGDVPEESPMKEGIRPILGK